MTNARTNLILLVVTFILLAVVMLEPGLDQTKPFIPLTSLNTAQVSQLVIRSTTRPVLSLSKTNGSWQLLANNGEIFPARTTQIQSLLGIGQCQSIRQYNPAEISLEKLGLQPAATTIELNDTLIELGNTDPLQQNRYALVNKSSVHLFTDRYSHLLNKRPEDWIETALLPPGSTLNGIEHPGFNLSLNQGQWQLQDKRPDVNKTRSQDILIALRDEWLHAQALDLKLLNEEQMSTLNNKPRVIVRLGGQPQAITFIWIKHDTGLTLVRTDWKLAYEFTEDAAARLLAPAGEHIAPKS